jgi:hypothetical protein
MPGMRCCGPACSTCLTPGPTDRRIGVVFAAGLELDGDEGERLAELFTAIGDGRAVAASVELDTDTANTVCQNLAAPDNDLAAARRPVATEPTNPRPKDASPSHPTQSTVHADTLGPTGFGAPLGASCRTLRLRLRPVLV